MPILIVIDIDIDIDGAPKNYGLVQTQCAMLLVFLCRDVLYLLMQVIRK